jgi:hypothetical protein
VQFVPMARDELLPALIAGKGRHRDGGSDRHARARSNRGLCVALDAGVDEIVVTSPKGPPIASLDDLSGKDVFVRESSSYYQSLQTLNARFAAEGKAP